MAPFIAGADTHFEDTPQTGHLFASKILNNDHTLGKFKQPFRTPCKGKMTTIKQLNMIWPLWNGKA
jgi:hypothetical protein